MDIGPETSFWWVLCFSLTFVPGRPSARELSHVINCNKFIWSQDGPSGKIQSTNYPRSYSSSTTCLYLFNSTKNERVQIRFTDMNLHYSGNSENPINCNRQDSITVYDLHENKETEIGVFCGSKQPPQIMSSGPSLKIEFKSRSDTDHTGHLGFEFLYNFRSDFGIDSGEQDSSGDCYFTYRSIQNESGRFVSPNHPGLYPKNTTCQYIFRGQKDEKVDIVFHSFEVEGSFPMCPKTAGSDFVTFSNFNGVEDRKMRKLCGKLVPEKTAVQSDSSYFRVVFTSNQLIEKTGFEAFYSFKKEKPLNDDPDPVTSSVTNRQASCSSLTWNLPVSITIAMLSVVINS